MNCKGCIHTDHCAMFIHEVTDRMESCRFYCVRERSRETIERLKAKLDEARAAVEEWLETSEWFEDDKLENILAIIDKDGE